MPGLCLGHEKTTEDLATGVTLEEFWRIYVVEAGKGLLADSADSGTGVRTARLHQFANFSFHVHPAEHRYAIQRGRYSTIHLRGKRSLRCKAVILNEAREVNADIESSVTVDDDDFPIPISVIDEIATEFKHRKALDALTPGHCVYAIAGDEMQED